MLPAQLLAAVAVQVFPLHAGIDLGPLALRVGTAYKITRVAVESAAGKNGENQISVGAAANLDDVAGVVAIVLSGMEKLAAVRQGVIFFTLTEFDGSPVRRVTFEFREAGPKPVVRWVPRRK
jgi:hypothetical protein